MGILSFFFSRVKMPLNAVYYWLLISSFRSEYLAGLVRQQVCCFLFALLLLLLFYNLHLENLILSADYDPEHDVYISG